MSKVKIEGNASGTGTLTISAPNTNTDRTINLPDDDITLAAFPDAINVNASAPADSLAIDSSGKVGIGTTTPNTPLSGATGIVLDSGSSVDCQLRLQNDTTGNTSTDGGILSISGSDMYLWNYENSTLRFGTNNTERMRILSGGGLTFNGDTASSNALDDYEEGTWTPSLNGTSNNSAEGTYVKIGNMVTCYGMDWGFTSTAVSAYITGFPFNSKSGFYVSGTVGANTWTNYGASLWWYSAQSGLMLVNCSTKSDATGIAGSPKYLSFSVTYRTT